MPMIQPLEYIHKGILLLRNGHRHVVETEAKALRIAFSLQNLISSENSERAAHYLLFGTWTFLSSKAFCLLHPPLKPFHIGGGIAGAIFQGYSKCPPQEYLEQNYYTSSHIIGYLNGSLHCAFQTLCYTYLASSLGTVGYPLGFLLANFMGRYSMCEIEKTAAIVADCIAGTPGKYQASLQTKAIEYESTGAKMQPSTCCHNDKSTEEKKQDVLSRITEAFPLNCLVQTLVLTALSPTLGIPASAVAGFILANTILPPLIIEIRNNIEAVSNFYHSFNASLREPVSNTEVGYNRIH